LREMTISRAPGCPEGTTAVVENALVACVPLDATCPRGTFRKADVCVRPPRCPPGTLATLADAASCRPIVTLGAAQGHPSIDVGAWVALVLGPDGGLGTPELCRPLVHHLDALGAAPHAPFAVRIRIVLAAPDQDISRIHAEVYVARDPRDTAGSKALPENGGDGVALPRAAQDAARESVETLLEPLRGLGGDANAANVKAEVHCGTSIPAPKHTE
jgi:hypothetical protein